MFFSKMNPFAMPTLSFFHYKPVFFCLVLKKGVFIFPLFWYTERRTNENVVFTILLKERNERQYG